MATGFGRMMRPDDFTFATYRGHAHTLAGVPTRVRARRAAGQGERDPQGQGRIDAPDVDRARDDGLLRHHRAHLTIANGAAWSAQMRGTDQVAVCFFGDGTTNIGAFHEALNLAAIWISPWCSCENNLWMEYTPIDLITAVANPAADRASAYGLEGIVVDGNDADAVYQVASQVISKARRGQGPSLVEAQTYREQGTAGLTRPNPPAEVQAWKDRGPDPDVPREVASAWCPGR